MATPCLNNTRQVYAKTAVETSGHPGKKPCRRRPGRDRKVGSAARVGLGSITPSTVWLIHRRVALRKRRAPHLITQAAIGVRSGRIPPPGPLPGTGVLVLRRRYRSGHWVGNGGCHHHGWSMTSIRSTHLTHQNPRRPGATNRAGAPWPFDSGSPPTWVARSRSPASRAGRRRRYPVTDTTSMLCAASSRGSRRSSRVPCQVCAAYQPPVQSSTARTVSVPAARGCLIHHRKRVADPLGDRHEIRFAGADLVRAGHPPVPAGQPECGGRRVAERRADVSRGSSPLGTVGDGPDSGPPEVA